MLDLSAEVLDTISPMGHSVPQPVITERVLRRLLRRPAEEQCRVMGAIVPRIDPLPSFLDAQPGEVHHPTKCAVP